jgi:HTH-type transcriptional regulator / antitoxin HigA
MKATLIVIQNDGEHAEAKALVGRLMQSDAETDRARGLAQARLIEAYEKTRWPRKRPALRDLLVYLMDQHGLTRTDLIPILGTASRVSEVLSGKRELSVTMIKRLRDRFDVPADLLLPPSRKRTAASRSAARRSIAVFHRASRAERPRVALGHRRISVA